MREITGRKHWDKVLPVDSRAMITKILFSMIIFSRVTVPFIFGSVVKFINT